MQDAKLKIVDTPLMLILSWGVVTVLLSFLPMKAANTSIMHNSDHMTV